MLTLQKAASSYKSKSISEKSLKNTKKDLKKQFKCDIILQSLV